MTELLIALVLILLNGLFSLSELAIVSSRRVRLKLLAENGRAGARAALALADDPGRFLSTVQIGITLVSLLAGAFSGAALSERASTMLAAAGVPVEVAHPLAFALVLGAITYLSVIVGELVPKHLALKNPEGIACAVAPGMRLVSRLAAPVVILLDASTRLVLALLGISQERDSAVTEEEVRSVVAEAEAAGAIETDERLMIAGVMRLADKRVRGIMTPRKDVEWIDLDDDEAEIRAALLGARHDRIPVARGSADNMVGVLEMRALVPVLMEGGRVDVAALMRPALVIPDTLDALDALAALQRAEVPMALVHDEYGHFDGVVTAFDALDAIAGALPSNDGPDDEPEAVERDDGSWLLAGSMPADRMADRLGLPLPTERDFETVAGFVISEFRRLPALGQSVEALGWRFEVVDLDGLRVDKVLASRLKPAVADAQLED